MFSLAEGHDLYKRIGLLLMITELALFFFGMPPFHVGIWLQTEPDMVALFSLATLDAAWLVYGLMKGILVPQAAPRIWYVMLAWVGWQVVPTVLALSPSRSWFGPVEMGEGLGWHLALFIIMCKAIPLWQEKSLRHIIMIAAALVISTEALLQVLFNKRDNLYRPEVWIPAQWGAYLAFMVGYFWVLMMAGNYVRRPVVYGVLIFFTVDVLIASYNKTAIALMPFAMLISLGVFLWSRKKEGLGFLTPTKRVRMLAVGAIVLPISWIVFCGFYVPPVETGETEHLELLNLSHKDSALGSRIGLMQVGLDGLTYEPWRLVYGGGWGEYTDTMFKYALVDGVRMYYNGQRQPNWMFVDGNAYHTHCQPLEALLALGLPGFLLWFAMPIVLIMSIPSRLFWHCVPVLIVLNAVSFLWFQLPQCVPICALMWAALCVACAEGMPEKSVTRSSMPLVAASLCVVLMALSAWQQYEGMMFGEKLYKGSRVLEPKDLPLPWLLTDIYRGADRFRVASMGYALSLDRERGDVDARQRDWYGHFMAAAKQMMYSERVGARGRYQQLWLEYKLLLNLGYPMFEELGDIAVSEMREAALISSSLAPRRDDLATFYLLNIDDVTKGDKKLQVEILKELLAAVPEHRPALWLLGHHYLADPATYQEGMQMILKSVAMNVQTVYPITDEQLAPYREALSSLSN